GQQARAAQGVADGVRGGGGSGHLGNASRRAVYPGGPPAPQDRGSSMTAPTRRRFDATWLPFGMMLGFVIGVGIGLSIIDNLLAGAAIGVLVGAGLGTLLGFRRGGGRGTEDEDAADEAF